MHLPSEFALIGGSQTLADNLIAILMNGIVALYFWNIVRGEWKTLPQKENFADVRRLYRYIWVLYSLMHGCFRRATNFILFVLRSIRHSGGSWARNFHKRTCIVNRWDTGLVLFVARRSKLDSGRGGTRIEFYASAFFICSRWAA